MRWRNSWPSSVRTTTPSPEATDQEVRRRKPALPP